MKLVRYGPAGKEKPGLIDADGKLRDLSRKVKDIDGAALAPAKLRELAKLDPKKLPLVKGKPRLGSCVATPSKFVAIGLNFSDHARETGSPIPEHPVVFFKAPSCIVGPNDNVMVPKDSTQLDWEVELVVVIGRRAEKVSAAQAWSHVAGLTAGQDISERITQLAGPAPQFSLGKSFPGFAPTGPWVVTVDEFDDPDDIGLQCGVGDETLQNGRTSDYLFGVPALIQGLSRVTPLLPGDIIFCGTPDGVGIGRDPQRFLQPGEELVSKVSGVGELRQTFVSV